LLEGFGFSFHRAIMANENGKSRSRTKAFILQWRAHSVRRKMMAEPTCNGNSEVFYERRAAKGEELGHAPRS
jgi:hypothetical protein